MKIRFKINPKIFNECTDKEKEEIKKDKVKNLTLRIVAIIVIEFVMTLWMESYITYAKEIFAVVVIIQLALICYSRITERRFIKYIVELRNKIIREKNKLILNAINKETNDFECTLIANQSFLEFSLGNITKIYETTEVKKVEIQENGLLLELEEKIFIIPNESFLEREKEELVKIIEESKKNIKSEKMSYPIDETIIQEEKFDFFDHKEIRSILIDKKEVVKEVRKRIGYITIGIYAVLAFYYVFLIQEVLGKTEVTGFVFIAASTIGILIYIGTPIAYIKKSKVLKRLKYSRSTEEYTLKFGERNLYVFKNDIKENNVIIKISNEFVKTCLEDEFNVLEVFGERYLYYPNKNIEIKDKHYKYRAYEKSIEKELVNIGKKSSEKIKKVLLRLMLMSIAVTLILIVASNFKNGILVLGLGIVIVILIGIVYVMASSGFVFKKAWEKLFNKITKERFNKEYVDVDLSYEDFLKNKFLINELYMRKNYIELALNNNKDRSDVVGYNSVMGKRLIEITVKASDLTELEKKSIIEELDKRQHIQFNLKEYTTEECMEVEYENCKENRGVFIRNIIKALFTLSGIAFVAEFCLVLGEVATIVLIIVALITIRNTLKKRKAKKGKEVKRKAYIGSEKVILNISKDQYKVYDTKILSYKVEENIFKLYKEEEEIIKIININDIEKEEIKNKIFPKNTVK